MNSDHETHGLLFGVRRSIRYHHRRQRFFDRLHKFSTFLSALTGTATFAAALAQAPHKVTLSFALAVALFSVIDLLVGTAQAARLHNDLARRFVDLEKEIISTDAKNHLPAFTTKRLDIEKDEPPPLKVLDSICHNELLRAMGYDASTHLSIKWYQRLLAQFFDVREHCIINPSEC